MDSLISDINKLIFDLLDFFDQINLRLVSNKFSIYPITNLCDGIHTRKLTNEILQLYPSVIKLNIGQNRKITHINNLPNYK